MKLFIVLFIVVQDLISTVAPWVTGFHMKSDVLWAAAHVHFATEFCTENIQLRWKNFEGELKEGQQGALGLLVEGTLEATEAFSMLMQLLFQSPFVCGLKLRVPQPRNQQPN